jgi:hypothetical protein
MSSERWLFLNPDKLAFVISPNGNVAIRLDYPRDETGLAPGIVLAMELTPDEARNVAEVLVRKAEEAEKKRH